MGKLRYINCSALIVCSRPFVQAVMEESGFINVMRGTLCGVIVKSEGGL